MARKRRTTEPTLPAVTSERAARLSRLLTLLGQGGQTRAALMRRLKLDVRGFYRDLQLLRAAGIEVRLAEGTYKLTGTAEAALQRLPFPDPRLTVQEAVQLSKGRSAAHQKLKDSLDHILPEQAQK